MVAISMVMVINADTTHDASCGIQRFPSFYLFIYFLMRLVRTRFGGHQLLEVINHARGLDDYILE